VLTYLLAMTLAVGRGEYRAVRPLAVKIVDAILDGARDRGRNILRTVLDQQQRMRPLTHTRPRRKGRSIGKRAA
jgi:hypothetical protein